jgi:hypothetical protein
MLSEARDLARIHQNVVVKVPLILDGIKAIRTLSAEGIRINCTLCFSPIQALIAAKARSTSARSAEPGAYVSTGSFEGTGTFVTASKPPPTAKDGMSRSSVHHRCGSGSSASIHGAPYGREARPPAAVTAKLRPPSSVTPLTVM